MTFKRSHNSLHTPSTSQTLTPSKFALKYNYFIYWVISIKLYTTFNTNFPVNQIQIPRRLHNTHIHASKFIHIHKRYSFILLAVEHLCMLLCVCVCVCENC